MKSTEFHPADYDAHGRLRLPFLFWCVPAVLAFLLSGRRFAFPVVWRWLRGLLLLAQLVLLCWQPVMWLAGDPVNGVGLALLVADVVALIWLLTNQRLRACFSLEKE